MGQVSAKLRSWSGGAGQTGYAYWCQGCEEVHAVATAAPPEYTGPVWGFDGDLDNPTFTPSVLVRWVGPDKAVGLPERGHICHTFITGGVVQFLGDCTHAMSGKTEPLPELPEHLKDRG